MLKYWVGILLTVFSCVSNAAKIDFEMQQLETAFKITHPVIPAQLLTNQSDQLIIFGEDQKKNKILAIYQFDVKTKQYNLYNQIIIPPNFLAFDILTTKNDQKIIFQAENELFTYEVKNNQFKKLLNINSIYLEPKAQFLAKRKMVIDINNDKLGDLIIPDFKSTHLYIQTSEGDFIHQQLSVPAKIRTREDSANYTENNFYFADINFDQKQDIVMVKDAGLIYYPQNKNKLFNLTSISLNLPIDVKEKEWWEIVESDGQSIDQHNLSHRSMSQIKDINNDGIADLLVRFSQSEGVLDRQNNYEVYLGYNNNEQLSFSSTPDSVIIVEGTTVGIKTIDIDGDNRSEIMLSSLDIGVSQIIGALLSGSIDQDVYIFKMNQQDKYLEDPEVSKEVDLNFSLSSGKSGAPVVKIADFNGDGLKDLLYSDGEKKLRINYGTNKKRMFKRRSKKYKIQLPKDGNLVEAHDLNQDGKHDLIIRYGRQDDSSLNNRLVFLFSN
ncbi:FG-GAP repeat domain-containing protein [Aliikangiella sp. IMCC44359]|uniref:FG-GAP repeat domain-containing protein n=1 Tax=Aliikangiella sp. IMCC44359 TaxID=3459125 RepID=UPI00403AD80F